MDTSIIIAAIAELDRHDAQIGTTDEDAIGFREAFLEPAQHALRELLHDIDPSAASALPPQPTPYSA